VVLNWALVLLVVAVVIGLSGFGNVAATAASMAEALFFVALLLFGVSLAANVFRRHDV
jgi:uncharacterized membrane protein YtjA (UPF0391 family)